MATFFGEIIPSFSRAVDDDEDDIESEEVASTCVRWSPVIRMELKLKDDGKLPCQVLVVAIGPAASGFVEAYILHEDYEIVGAIFSGMKDTDVNTFEQTSPTDKTCYIYRSRSIPNVFVCTCKTDVDEEQSYTWTNQLFSCLDVLTGNFYASILCSYMTSEYRSEIPTSDMNPPFLRGLKTTKFMGTPLCPFLEQPNLVSGLPAQVLTHCQMLDVKAVMYICYTDSIFLDQSSMKLFYPLIQSTPIKDIMMENPKADEKLTKIVEQYSIKNSLYL